MKKYNIINDSLGWLCFVIAAVTYLLTIEPTASFWDCPEFILQGAKLEIGHPPGNPIFMLAARFFVTIFGNNIQHAAVAVNSMSALLSAGTILLLFWTITHLVRKLIVRDDTTEISATRTALIMGAGICGALAYTWSDTFWFSAVEGEVYAFSSFCTALVFWLILKWENRADQPHSDRYLLLIAYIIGISIAVHLLNLLCIPAIGLVIYYRKFKKINAIGSLLALAVSCAVVGVILFGMVPGVMKMCQWFERIFVNGLGMPFNFGALIYAVLLLAVLIWSVVTLYRQKIVAAMKWSFFIGVLLSGVLLIGHSAVLPVLLIGGLGVWLLFFCKPVPVRVLNLIITSIMVIFIGYSSYALLLIRSTANTPMNQQAPDNVFTLASYLNREQYGSAPLLYGPTIIDEIVVDVDYDQSEYIYFDENGEILTSERVYGSPTAPFIYSNETRYPVSNIPKVYTKKVKSDPGEPDEYVEVDGSPEYEYIPESEVFFPRMYNFSDNHRYRGWAEIPAPKVPQELYDRYAVKENAHQLDDKTIIYTMPAAEARELLEAEGISRVVERYEEPAAGTEMDMAKTPYKYNLAYFFGYQLNHMYWRYFMWNFAGRQNDFAGNGEPHLGNWISGIPAIDNKRLGDQSLLPEEYGTGNKGHNVFYMLPLLLGVIGLLWQSLCRHAASADRGIQQFWVVFFLFFMTGIAIVLYLNQTPGQPRERDYAFAGSFYAFAIWIGMGVPALGIWIRQLLSWMRRRSAKPMPAAMKWCATVPALAIGVAVPLQMVSQTWDDHDRSGRYTARDFGMNYLSSVEPDGIIFTYGDNDTFPLWYAQEVEGYRTDVKVINLSYFTSDWYVNSLRMPHHGSKPIELMATPQILAYRPLVLDIPKDASYERVDALTAFKDYYSQTHSSMPKFNYPNFYITSDSAGAARAFDLVPGSLNYELGFRNADMDYNLLQYVGETRRTPYQQNILTFDLIALNAANGWKRPIYFATTVPESEKSGFDRYSYLTGMAEQVTPFDNTGISPNSEKAYRNILEKFRWGGLDAPDADKLYLDETVRRMVMSTRGVILRVANELLNTGDMPASEWAVSHAKATGSPVPQNRYDMARELIRTVETKLPTKAMLRYNQQVALEIQMWLNLYDASGNKADLAEARKILDEEWDRYSKIYDYASSLDPKPYKLAYGELKYDIETFLNLKDFKSEIEAYEKGSLKPRCLMSDDELAEYYGSRLPLAADAGVPNVEAAGDSGR